MSGRELAQRTPAQEMIATVASDGFVAKIAAALPIGMSPRRFTSVAVTALRLDPDLGATNHESLYSAILRCAQDGLLPDGREATLVAYKDGKTGERHARYMPMIGGYRKIAAKHGYRLVADVVREGDEFDWSRVPPQLTHKPAAGDQRGEIVYAYAVAFDRRWRFAAAPVVMTVAEVERVRAVSRAANSGPWTQWWDRMAAKTAARRLFSELPLSGEDEQLARLLAAADEEFDFDLAGEQAARAALKLGRAPLGPPSDDTIDDAAAAAAQDPAGEPSGTAEPEPPAPAPEPPLEGAGSPAGASPVEQGSFFEQRAAEARARRRST